MMYCVVKNTTNVICTNENREIMLMNARNAGFEESEVDLLTVEKYLERKELEPKPTPQLSETDILSGKVEMLGMQTAMEKIASMKINAEKDLLINSLGSQMAQMRIDMMILKGGV